MSIERGTSTPEAKPMPVVFLKPGFGETGKTFKTLQKELNHVGYSVVVAEHPRPKKRTEVLADIEEAKVFARAWYTTNRPDITSNRLEALLASIPPTLYEEALTLIQCIIESGVGSAPKKVAGHSQGAPASTFAAFLRPDLFSSPEGSSTLLLMNPAGLTGKMELKRSKELRASGKVLESRLMSGVEMFGDISRALGIIARDLVITVGALMTRGNNPEVRDAFWGWLKHVGRHEAVLSMRIVEEAHDMANTDILPFLEIIQGNGVSITISTDEDDHLFRSRIIKKRVSKTPSISLHTTSKGGHFMPLVRPREAAQIAHSVFSGA